MHIAQLDDSTLRQLGVILVREFNFSVGLKLNIKMKESRIMLSSGNRLTGIISYIGVFLVAIVMICWDPLLVEFWIAAIIMVLFYSFQMFKTAYISVTDDSIFIDNIFKGRVDKNLNLYKDVVEILPFMRLMSINFKDKTSYFFLGRYTSSEINALIREKL